MKKLFGTDGIRGEAGNFPLDASTIKIIGASLTKQLTEKLGRAPRFVTGRDTRESGEWIENAFCAGASGAGATCESAEIITTPGVAFLTKEFGFDAGVVISASHNPFQDNGIKIFSPDGKKIDEATERKIEEAIHRAEKSGDSNAERQDKLTECDTSNAAEMRNRYMNYLADEFKTLDLSDFKMVIDCANGAAYELAPPLFRRFGAETVVINDQPDGRNINKNCGSLHLDKLREKVLEEQADFGVAFDGDADRALFVDEQGNLTDGDACLWIMANRLQADGRLNNRTVVATVMSNLGLEVALDSKNIKLARTAVGDKYVLQELLNSNCSIGGEQSGHIIFPFHSLVGDGMLTTLFLLEAIRKDGKSLSEIKQGFVQFPQILVNVKVREKLAFESVEEIAAAAAEVEKELGKTGRLLLRYSGTENLARVMIEGANQTEIEAQAHRLAGIIKERLG